MGDIAQYEFKGVTVVVATILMVLLLGQAPAHVDAITAVKLDSSALQGQASDAAAAASSVPYCIYLDQSEELDCVCPSAADADSGSNHRDSAPINFPNEDYLMVSHNQSVAAIKLHSCSSLNLRLDLRSLERPFYR